MSNSTKSIRIPINIKDSKNIYYNLSLKQDFNEISLLSLTLKQSQIYRSFSSDYGMLVGRCLANNGLGIPNCKVSIFIPISDIDKLNNDIVSVYPFTTPSDKDSNGKRYNLLNRLKKLNPFSGFRENPYQIGYQPKTTNGGGIGSIAEKVEILTNPTQLDVYERYYKFSTVSNASGDYCIFGLPTGNQIVTFDVDITDIGRYSASNSILSQVQGLPPSLFNTDGTKVNNNSDIDSIGTIQHQTTSVNIIPFWGDSSTGDIGITRQDFNIRTKITPFFTLFGSNFTQNADASWGDKNIFRVILGFKNFCLLAGNSCDPSTDNTPGVSIRLGAYMKLKVFGKTIINQGFGNTDNCQPDNNVLKLCFCLKIIIENIIPFICINSPFGFNQCDISGGEFSDDAIAIDYLGKTSTCGDCTTIENSSPELTTKLNLDNYRVGQISEKIFTYNPDVSLDDINSFNTDINNDIRLLQTNEYAKIPSESGTFIYQIPCNSGYMITDEFGNLIPSTDNTGLPLLFNGYMIFSMNDLSIDSSGSKIKSDRVNIKVPASQDYNDSTWVQSSYNFSAGSIYSVAQFLFAYDPINTETLIASQTGIILDVNTQGLTDDTQYGPDMEMVNNNTISVAGVNRPIFKNAWINGALIFPQVNYRHYKGKRQDIACPILLGHNVRTTHNTLPLGGNVVDNYYILNNQYFQTNFVNVDKTDFTSIIAGSSRRGLTISDTKQYLMPTAKSGIKYFYRGLFDNADSITNFIDKDVV